jgi:hypothetical protein
MPQRQVLNWKLDLLFFSDFDGDGEPDNVSFMIKRIKVHSKDAVEKDKKYRFPGNYGVEKFLEIFSGEWAELVRREYLFFALRRDDICGVFQKLIMLGML